MSSGSVHSVGLWLTPLVLGMKIMPVGVILAICMASWPAPDGITSKETPRSSHVPRMSAITSGCIGTGSSSRMVRISAFTPRSRAICRARFLISPATLRLEAEVMLRTSTCSSARPGMALMTPGSTLTAPTVPTTRPLSAAACSRQTSSM